MTQIKVKFPFITYLEDYHEGAYVTKILQELTKKTIFHSEDGSVTGARGYRFVFDVKPLNLDDDDSFSRDKEAFIAP